MFSAIPCHAKFLIDDSERKQREEIPQCRCTSFPEMSVIQNFISLSLVDSLALTITLTMYKGEKNTSLSCAATIKINVQHKHSRGLGYT